MNRLCCGGLSRSRSDIDVCSPVLFSLSTWTTFRDGAFLSCFLSQALCRSLLIPCLSTLLRSIVATAGRFLTCRDLFAATKFLVLLGF